MKRLSKKGFTLVELLVVMAIIGILAAVIMGGFRSSQRRSRDAKRKSDLRQIGQALELFYADYDRYPDPSPPIGGLIAACPYYSASDTGDDCAWGADKMEESPSGRIYFRELPSDSNNNYYYYYRTLNSNQSYQLYARLENGEDQHCIDGCCASATSGCALPALPGSVNCGAGGVVCDFAVTSTDVTAKD